MRIIRPADQARSSRGAFSRGVAVSRAAGAKRLWVASAEMGLGAISGPHHHGEAETAIYILEGVARFYVGPGLREVLEATAGDFVWVEPREVHVELNRSQTEPLRMIVVRTPGDIALDATVPPGWAPG
jgi:uncharacterized RmlC-like cupin family protein